MSEKIRVASLEEMGEQAKKVLEVLRGKAAAFQYGKALVVGLSGDLGSGKTTFSQMVATQLGVTDRVTSPTFVIEKIYKTKDARQFETFVHIDAYRLEKGAELDVLNFKDILEQSHTLVFIEWPEKVKEGLPADLFRMNFEFIDEKTRQISY